MKTKQIYLLIGQKGSGKSFIGTIFKKHFNIDFERMENWLLDVKKGRNIDDDEYAKECFQIIENGVRKELEETEILVFESTGLTEHFDSMLSKLQLDYNVTTILIKTDSDICFKRVRTRDQSIHINISDKQLEKINSAVLSKNLKTDFIIENNYKTEGDLIVEIRKIIDNIACD